MSKPIFYDSDVLISFLSIERVDILKNLFSKIILPEPVYHELISIEKFTNLKEILNNLIDEDFVEIAEFYFASPEETNYNLIHRGYWTNGKVIGKGESAAMAFAIENNGVVASNNLSDVLAICADYEIPIITSSIILYVCYELNMLSKNEIEIIWNNILNTNKQKLPKQTFDEYYNELFRKDCNILLKNYDFKKMRS